MNSIARESARAARQHEVAVRRAQREYEREQRLEQRAQAAAEKEERLRYLHEREAETEALNEDVERRLAELTGILEHTLGIDDTISLDSLRMSPDFRAFVAPAELAAAVPTPMAVNFMGALREPSVLWRWIPWVQASHQRKLAEAERRYNAARKAAVQAEQERFAKLRLAREHHEAEKAAHSRKAAEHNGRIEEFVRAYAAGRPDAVAAYSAMVLERSTYPDEVEVGFDVDFVAEPRELVISFQLPTANCVPEVAEYKYVKSRDSIDEKSRPVSNMRAFYLDAIAGITLRTIHEVFEADQKKHLNSVVFNGFVRDVDPATGRDEERCLVAVRAKRAEFMRIDLRRVENVPCLANLGARLSSRPDELQAVEELAPYGSGHGVVEADVEPSKQRARSRG